MHFILYNFSKQQYLGHAWGRKSEKNYLHVAFYQIERCLEVDKDFKGLLKT